MRPSTLSAVLLTGIITLVSSPAWSAEPTKAEQYCGTQIPPDEAIGFVPLPEGDVFCPLIADPKAIHSFVSYVRGSSTSALGTDLGSVGVGDRYAIARWGGPTPGEGVQVGIEGAIFAQFDLNTPSYDLVNADYLAGVPLTLRRKWCSARIRVYHQSSHLGDEYLLRSHITRENLAYESLEGILSIDARALRIYAGGEYLFNGQPSSIETQLVHGGVELRQRGPLTGGGGLANVRFVAGADVKAVETLDWELGWSARAGFEVSSARRSAHASRSWSLVAEYYDGPSPYGQFFRSDVTYFGAGLHLAP